jgi:nicotinamidase-related amidase
MTSTVTATPTPAKSLLTPQNHLLMMIDQQPQMAFATATIDIGTLRSNTALVAKSAAGFGVKTLITSVSAADFSGYVLDEVVSALPDVEITDRTTMNCWEDPAVIERVNGAGVSRVVMAGLWTSVCIAEPALSAIEQGFEVYFITDACGDVSAEAHQMAVQRILQAGAVPITSLQYLLELQRDWGRSETYQLTTGIARALGGAYGIGVAYAETMLGGHEGGKSQAA